MSNHKNDVDDAEVYELSQRMLGWNEEQHAAYRRMLGIDATPEVRDPDNALDADGLSASERRACEVAKCEPADFLAVKAAFTGRKP